MAKISRVTGSPRKAGSKSAQAQTHVENARSAARKSLGQRYTSQQLDEIFARAATAQGIEEALRESDTAYDEFKAGRLRTLAIRPGSKQSRRPAR